MEWIKFGRTFREFQGHALDSYAKIGPDLAQPGVQVLLEDGRTLLLGDVNCLGGGCDDCPDLRSNDRIMRYRQVVPEELLRPS